MVRLNAGLMLVTFPVASEIVCVTDQTPSSTLGRLHPSALPTTYEQVTVVDPFFAVMVTVSPTFPPLPLTNGVRSAVTLSEFFSPVSELGVRSGGAETGEDGGVDGTVAAGAGALGAAGAAVSTVTANAGPGADALPAGSVTTDVMLHTPSAKVGRSHDDDVDDCTYEQVTVTPSLDAVIVTDEPSATPGTPIAGVASLVTSSVDERPVSDDATRSGAPGDAGAAASTVTANAGPGADALPAGSVTTDVMLHTPSAKVGRSHDDDVDDCRP